MDLYWALNEIDIINQELSVPYDGPSLNYKGRIFGNYQITTRPSLP